MKRPISGSLNALTAFDAAARHLSFTAAAQELHLSQPSVSRYVQTLECRLGQALFWRQHNKLQLTDAGKRLADATNLGFGHIEAAWRELAQIPSNKRLTLACSDGFSALWLSRRYRSLRAALPDVPLDVVTFRHPSTLNREQIDALIRWDAERWPGFSSMPLFAEAAGAVCAPILLERIPGLAHNETAIETLAKQALLTFDVGDSGFWDWPSWFAAHGVSYRDPADIQPYSNYHYLMRAVLDGDGIALGWQGLVDDLLERGDLIALTPMQPHGDCGYQLEYRLDGPGGEATHALVKWFQQQSSQ